MAKLKGKAKVAFLRRMAAGRAKKTRRAHRIGKSHGRSRPRRRHAHSRIVTFRRNPIAIIANPGRPKRKRRRKGKSTMATKRRRRRHTRKASPRRRRHSRRPTHTRRRRRSHARRAPRIVYINPRKKHRSRRGRKHNPGGVMGAVKKAFTPFAVGFVTSVGAAAIDKVLADRPWVRRVVKGAGAVLIAVMGRRYPVASTAAIAALGASEGYSVGANLVGSLIVHSPAQAVEAAGKADMSPEMGALLNGGVGALLNGLPNLETNVVNYETALQGLGDDDE